MNSKDVHLRVKLLKLMELQRTIDDIHAILPHIPPQLTDTTGLT